MKHFKSILALLILGVVFMMPLTSQAEDRRTEGEWLGRVTDRPDGLTGPWVIGSKSFEATRRTRFKQENGPLDVGACVKVKYTTDSNVNYASRIESQEAEKCRDESPPPPPDGGNGGGDNGGGGGDNGGGTPPDAPGGYVIIGWNDLGMHCMDPSFEDFAVLPPYNTLWAQVIRRGSEPEIVTGGVTVEYSFIDNTDSVSKTNFWEYAHLLFNLPQPLQPNVGLAGFGLSGEMHPTGDHFAAEGIPLTEYRDSDLSTPYPYQLAELVAKDAAGNVLATTQTVAPVSTEMNCQNCHNDNGMANPDIATGVLKQNILTLHDIEEGTTLMDQRPVLCAGCHGSNALKLAGEPGVPNLSLAMHGKHQNATNDCEQCHPGPQTKCLRGTMAADGMTCQDCHGNMSDVADPGRNPWLDEPRCETCHDSAHGENPNTLYRFSTGHGGVYCQACHGSQHAIYPTMQPNDNIQSIMLQGKPGTIDTCTVCHTSTPDGDEGPHAGDSEGNNNDGGENNEGSGRDSRRNRSRNSSEVESASVRQGGDVNGDGQVNMLDLVSIMSAFGGEDADADLNRDGRVDMADLTIAAGHMNTAQP